MLSAVDTLLEAAKFLEQQEQQHPTRQLQASRSFHRTPPPLHHQQHHATTNTSVSSNSGRPGAAAANSNGTVSYATTIVSNGNGGLFGGSSTSSASGIVSSTSTSTTTITGNGGNGFVSPPPAGNSIINGNHHGSTATGLPLKSKVLLNGLAHNHLQHQHPHQLPQQANGSGGRLLSPTLVSLPAGAALSSVAAAAGSYHQPTVTTIATSPAPRLQHLPIVATRKRTYSNASNGGGPTVSSTSSPPSTTTATVLVGSAASYVTKDEPLVNGHSTAPPLVVISNNSTQHHAKHLTTSHVSLVAATTTTTLASSPVTIDLSTKGLNHQQNAQYQLPSGGHQQHAPTVHPALGVAGLPTTPPASNLASLSSSSSSSSSSSPSSSSSSSSSSCSSNSSAGSTLTVSPIDDSQSSLNLSNGSSINGYITSANSSTGGGITATITTGGGSASSPLPPALGGVLPVSINGVLQASAAVSTAGSINGSNAIVGSQHPGMLSHLSMDLQQQVAAHSPSAGAGAGAMFANVPTGTRRRTTSSNSNGVGTREVHNKLEKNRRAHLKECFEQLKKQLSLQPDEKKISNLSILHAAIRHIQLLKRKEREFEHEMERLAKEKIAAQNRILLLKREITQMGDIDVSRLAPDTDITPNPSSGGAAGSLNLVTGGVPSERDHLTENTVIGTIMQGRNGVRYSSSSSLSSIATNASITSLPIQTTISPVLSVSSPSRGSPALLRSSTSPPSSSLAPSSLSVSSVTPSSVMLPLSLTTKGSNGLASEAQNGPVGGSSTQPALKFTTAPLNGLNLSNASVVNGSVTGSAVTVNGTNGTTAPLPVIVGANGTTSIVGITHPQLLTTTVAPSIQTLPLNLNVTSSAKSNGLSGNGGPTSIAITTSNGGSSGHLSAHQAIQLTSSTNGTNGGSVNGSSITTTASGTNARSVYNAAIANGTTTIATNTLAGTMVMTAAGLPLLAANGKELINGTIGKNGTVRTESSKLEIIATQSQPTNHTAAVGATAALDPPGTKVITLMNGSHTFALGPLEKDSKMGSVVYSPILVPTPQGLRVIQPGSNGLATIELAPPNGGNRLQLHLTH